LKHGARVDAREDKWHGTPAGWAHYAGRNEVRDLILKSPVDIMEAVDFDKAERIAEILAKDPEALNRSYNAYPIYPLYAEGWHTPFAFAVVNGKIETVRMLLGRGADATLRSPEGKSLLQLAEEKGQQEITALLRNSESNR
jgi:hypothetical protein